jgi:hypothetical protein
MRLVQGIFAVPFPYRHSAIVGAMPLMLLSCACNCPTFCLQEGYGFEPRRLFYVWRAWAAAALPFAQ